MKKISALVVAGLCFALSLQANPKHEFRGAWISTVLNLDWPSSRTATPAVQQAELISQLDALKAAGINAVFFQVRTEADALYDSPYEPWSYYLTGTEGQPPSPFWDPLTFAIEEAHKRGMELHAWLNPYRAVRNSAAYTRAAGHVSNTQPDWILTFGSYKILNPGLPQVTDHIVNIVRDIVERYNVDGIHFDDYFYPYAPNEITNEDAQTFSDHGGSFTDIGDWRRDNINRMMEAVNDAIKAEKPHVIFGVSPFGIWRPGHPAGISGTDAYNSIYADALAWVSDESVDYLVPQLYWAFGGGQDYGALAPWWVTASGSRHMYTGNAAYKMLPDWNWPLSEITDQLQFNRNESIPGIVFFRTGMLVNNLKGLRDELSNNFFSTPALTPVMSWLDTDAPPAPNQVAAWRTGGSGTEILLQWEHPTLPSSATDTTSRYVIYRVQSASEPDPSSVTSDPTHIVDIIGSNRFEDTISLSPDPYYYVITRVTSNGVESTPVMVQVTASESVVYYYSRGDEPLHQLAAWNTLPDGSGGSPSSFADAGRRYVLLGGEHTLTSNLSIGGDSELVIGDGVSSTSLNIPSDVTLQAKVEVVAQGSLTIRGTQSPDIIRANPLSTVHFYTAGSAPTLTMPGAPGQAGQSLPNQVTPRTGEMAVGETAATETFARDGQSARGTVSTTPTGANPIAGNVLAKKSAERDAAIASEPTMIIPTPASGYGTLRLSGPTTRGFDGSSLSIHGNLQISGEPFYLACEQELRLYGNFIDNTPGAEPATIGGKLVFTGNAEQTFTSDSRTYTVKELVVDKSANEVTLNSTLHIESSVELSSGVMTSGGNLRLLSDGVRSTARVLPTGSGSVSGAIVAERWLTATASPGSVAPFLLGNPLESTFAGEDGLLSSIWTQGTVGASTSHGSANVLWYNASYQRTSASDPGGWTPVDDLNASMVPGMGYLTWIFTDDIFGTDGSWPKTLSSAGAFNSYENDGSPFHFDLSFVDNQQEGVQLGGFNLIANPFLSPIRWSGNISRGNVLNAYWVLEPDGTFSAYDGDSESGTGSADGVIDMHQGFLVLATGEEPTMSLTSEVKYPSETLHKSGHSYQVRLSLKRADDTLHEALVVFSNEPGASMVPIVSPLAAETPVIFTANDADRLSIQAVYRGLDTPLHVPVMVSGDRNRMQELVVETDVLPEGWTVSFVAEEGVPHAETKESGRGLEAKIRLSANAYDDSLEALQVATLIFTPPAVTGDVGGEVLPQSVELLPNYPNPFNPGTFLRFSIPERAQVRFSVYSLTGQLLAVISDAVYDAGYHQLYFDGAGLASGVYIYRMETSGQIFTDKMILVK